MKTQNLHLKCLNYLDKVHSHMTAKDSMQYNYCFVFLNEPTPLSTENQLKMEMFFNEEL